MTRKRRLAAQISVFIIVITAVFLVRISVSNRIPESENSPAIPVRVAVPQRMRLEDTIKAYGNLKSANQVTLLPKVAGSVTSISVDVGDEVDVGTLLAEIDREAYELDLKRANAAFSNAASTWERVDRLYAAGNSTRQVWEDANAAYTGTEAQAAAARLRYDWTRIISPAPGVVLVRHANVGSLVAPDAITPLFTVGSLDDLEIELQIPEAYYPSFSMGLEEVRALSMSFPDQIIKTEIGSIAPWIDPATRTFEVTCHIVSSNETLKYLRPGMYLSVEFVLKVRDQVPALPIKALSGGRWLWKVGADGLAQRVEIENPLVIAGYVVVPEEWETDSFVIEGQHFLQDGTELRILDGPSS